MSAYAKKYPAKADTSKALIPDFKYLKMGLATASAEQRLILVFARSDNQATAVQGVLAPVVWDESIQGKFHIDLESNINKYRDVIKNLRVNNNGSILIIEPDEYGIENNFL
ncbi:MAG: hypothetical protein MK132_00130 [Lentisphaerales bacterium]|nr:hypothetical protein [Lentisphaerales bacterium]